MGRRLAPPPGAEKRRRGGAEPAQPARGRGGAARRDRPRQARPGAWAGGTGLRRLPRRSPTRRPFRPERLAAVAADLQSPLDPQKAAELAAALRKAGGARPAGPDRRGRGRRSGDRAARRRRAARDLGADAALAKSLELAGPRCRLLAGELFVRRATGEGRRPRPGEAGWVQARGAQLTRARRSPPSTWPRTCRAARPGSRTPRQNCAPRGRAGRLEALLADDAVSAAAPIPSLSDRARRRLFERLVALGAARELTGRATFRLYGL